MTEKTINREYEPIVWDIFREVMGNNFQDVLPNPSHPDSIVYTGVGKTSSFVFKMMDPKGKDADRISAEAWALTQAKKAGCPTPEVALLDASLAKLPSTYMVMHQAQGSDLRTPQLDDDAMRPYLLQIGQYLRQLHEVKVEGFGFLVSDEAGKIRGYKDNWKDAALDAVEDGLRVLSDNSLITSDQLQLANKVVETQSHLLETDYNALLHGDLGMIHVFADLETEKVTSFIDFGECKSGDPVWDFVDIRRKYVRTIIEGYEPNAAMRETWDDRFALLGLLRQMIWAKRWYNVWPESVGNVLKYDIEFAGNQFGLS